MDRCVWRELLVAGAVLRRTDVRRVDELAHVSEVDRRPVDTDEVLAPLVLAGGALVAHRALARVAHPFHQN